MNNGKMMGVMTPGDQRVNIAVREWNSVKLALWRSRAGWVAAQREAAEIVAKCEHKAGCPAIDDETAPCLQDRYAPTANAGEEDGSVQAALVEAGCPDRELRMSGLVILNAARMFAPVIAPRPAAELYIAPSREYFSEIIAELLITQAELEALREVARTAGLGVPSPPPTTPSLLPTRTPPQLEESK